MIYLDNAATSYPKPEGVVRAVQHALTACGANPGRAGHTLAIAAGRIVEACREAMAELVGETDASRIAFTGSTTQALNEAIYGAVRAGDHVITTLLEHNSVLRPLSELSRRGIITLTLVPPDAQGRIGAEQIERELTPRTRLVAMTHMSNVQGVLQDLAAVGQLCRKRGVLLLADCAQTAGHYPLRLQTWGVSMAAIPGHKGLLGPHGTGALWVKKGLQIAPLMQGGTGSASESMFQPRMMPDMLESGTLNLPGIAGLRAGIARVRAQGMQMQAHIRRLCSQLREQLEGMPQIRIYTPPQAILVTFNIEGIGSQEAASMLDAEGIAVRGGLHCAPGVHRFLGTLQSGAIRVSPGPYNTQEEIRLTAAAIARIAQRRGG